MSRYIFAFYWSCEINYHHNYKVYKDEHIYHGGIPDMIQVGKHQFIEWEVVEVWLSLMDHGYVLFSSVFIG